jgi:hypothetical protein
MVNVHLILAEVEVMHHGEAYTYWKVKDCFVHMTESTFRGVRSGEEYETKEDARMEMERRVLELLKENGWPETANDLKWKVTTVADSQAAMHLK